MVALCQAKTNRESSTEATHECISFVSEDEPVNNLARAPLDAAVTLSGDYDFYPTSHTGCWEVNVVAMSTSSGSGACSGYAVAWAVTDPYGAMWGHGLNAGPDKDTFDRAMRAAAVDAIKDIRQMRAIKLMK